MRVGLGGGEVVDAAPGSHGDMQVERLSIETRDRHTERDRQLIDRNSRGSEGEGIREMDKRLMSAHTVVCLPVPRRVGIGGEGRAIGIG